ncbi:hypothetical protein GE061_011955 [Apolygus lucorum]|uniref:Uncharacterized protein n=1 Tax=Apolygus lucorum TaxID=248454 RepID=A0A8S9XR72_APOLU|nr:hypothetical protein GE061_011955 [Apolygus lucorum]
MRNLFVAINPIRDLEQTLDKLNTAEDFLGAIPILIQITSEAGTCDISLSLYTPDQSGEYMRSSACGKPDSSPEQSAGDRQACGLISTIHVQLNLGQWTFDMDADHLPTRGFEYLLNQSPISWWPAAWRLTPLTYGTLSRSSGTGRLYSYN